MNIGKYSKKIVDLSKPNIIVEMRWHMDYVWECIFDHKKRESLLNIEKYKNWLWLINDQELLNFSKKSNNLKNYGIPFFVKICKKYKIAIPNGKYIQNMIKGKPCTNNCKLGCL